MDRWARASRLACVVPLVLVTVSCASPDERISASPAAAGGSSPSSASPVPPSPVPAPQPPAPSPQPPAPAPQAPAPQPQPQPQAPAPQPQAPAPAPQAPAPQPQAPAPQPQAPAPQAPAAPPPNPNPPPGTVSYDLPNVGGSDIADQDNWQSGYRNNCTTAGHPPDCLHMSVVVSALDANGNVTPIDNPGPDYFGDGIYERCAVTSITPEPPVEVPVGTTVVITALCEPVDDGAA